MDELFEAYGGADLLNSEDDNSQPATEVRPTAKGKKGKDGKKEDSGGKSKKGKKSPPADKKKEDPGKEGEMEAELSEPVTPSSEEGEEVEGYPGRLQPME